MIKTIVFIGILFFCACSDSKLEKSEREDHSKVVNEFTTRGIEALRDLKKQFDFQMSLSRSDQQCLPWFDIDGYKLTQIEYFIFDDEKFYENPEPSRLVSCFNVDTTILCFEGRKNDQHQIRFTMKYDEERWYMSHYLPEWGNIISWLQPKLMTDSMQYSILDHDKFELILLGNNGQYDYYDLRGNQFTEDQICEFLLYRINRGKNRDKEEEKWKKIFEDGLRAYFGRL